MIDKYAEIQDRILLYNACKGILRTKLAALEKDAWIGAAIAKAPAILGSVANGIGTAGKYIGTAGRAIGSAAAPIVSGVNKAVTGLNKLRPIADGLGTVGKIGTSVTALGGTAIALKPLLKQLDEAYLSEDAEDTSAKQSDQQAAASPASGTASAAQTSNPYPNDEGIDNSDLPPGLDMNSPDVILALLSNNRPITTQQRAIINKYLAQMQQQQAAGQQPAANQQSAASTNPALYANTVTNPAQGQM